MFLWNYTGSVLIFILFKLFAKMFLKIAEFLKPEGMKELTVW